MPATAELSVALDDLEAWWAGSATEDELAMLPELAGPVGYLSWAWEGLAAAHMRLASAVPGTPQLPDLAADLVRQAGLRTAPGELAAAIGTPDFIEVQERLPADDTFTPDRWHDQTRSWLARALGAGEIDACRAWLDMAVRITGILQGLPCEPESPAPCYVPVGAFQRDIRALTRPRRARNPLAASLAARRPGVPALAGTAPGSGEHAGPAPDSHAADDPLAELAGLPGLASVSHQLTALAAVAQAEAARRQAGITLRPAWKNLAFAGPPGSGKSRVAAILGRIYRDLGVLSGGHLAEVTRTDLSGSRPPDTTGLVEEAVRRGRGGILLISDAHKPGADPAEDTHALRLLEQTLEGHRDGDLIVVLAGPEQPLHLFLASAPGLASRVPHIVTFPGYTAAELAEIFAWRAAQAGFTLTGDAAAKASNAITGTGAAARAGSARVALQLLDQTAVAQGRRIMGGDAEPSVLTADDIPDQLAATSPGDPPRDPFGELDQMTGLTEVKEQVRLLAVEARADQLRRDAGMPDRTSSRHSFVYVDAARPRHLPQPCPVHTAAGLQASHTADHQTGEWAADAAPLDVTPRPLRLSPDQTLRVHAVKSRWKSRFDGSHG